MNLGSGITVNPYYYQENMFRVDLVKTQINDTDSQLVTIDFVDKKIIFLWIFHSLSEM